MKNLLRKKVLLICSAFYLAAIISSGLLMEKFGPSAELNPLSAWAFKTVGSKYLFWSIYVPAGLSLIYVIVGLWSKWHTTFLCLFASVFCGVNDSLHLLATAVPVPPPVLLFSGPTAGWVAVVLFLKSREIVPSRGFLWKYARLTAPLVLIGALTVPIVVAEMLDWEPAPLPRRVPDYRPGPAEDLPGSMKPKAKWVENNLGEPEIRVAKNRSSGEIIFSENGLYLRIRGSGDRITVHMQKRFPIKLENTILHHREWKEFDNWKNFVSYFEGNPWLKEEILAKRRELRN